MCQREQVNKFLQHSYMQKACEQFLNSINLQFYEGDGKLETIHNIKQAF